jgi:hypothetical protein
LLVELAAAGLVDVAFHVDISSSEPASTAKPH